MPEMMTLGELMIQSALNETAEESHFALIMSLETGELFPGKIDDLGAVRFLCGMSLDDVHEVPLLTLNLKEVMDFRECSVDKGLWSVSCAPEEVVKQHWEGYADPMKGWNQEEEK